MEKTIGSVIIMVIAAIVGIYLGAALGDATLGGSILLVLIAGIGCIVSAIESLNRDE